MVDLEKNLASVRRRIERAAEKAGRNPQDVTLVAVTKTYPAETVLAAHSLGVTNVGENRVEEVLAKIPAVEKDLKSGEPLTWHLIGHLQHRKVRDAVRLFDIVESVDSVALARRLNERAKEAHKRLPILLEVNTSGETNKFGFKLDASETLLAMIQEILRLEHLDVQGLMTMAPIVGDPEEARPYFRMLRQLRETLRERYPERTWPHLSMGMSNDFEVALAEGATMVRIGRAIFGERI